MPTDLRAEVLAGIDREIACVNVEIVVTLTALRHLREIVERHMDLQAGCGCCGWSRRAHGGAACRVILSLAPDYAPQALAEMEVDRAEK